MRFGTCWSAASTARNGRAAFRHLGKAALDGPRNPIRVRETAVRKCLKLPVHIVLDAADAWHGVIEQKVRGPAIAVERKPNAAGVGDGHRHIALVANRNVPDI